MANRSYFYPNNDILNSLLSAEQVPTGIAPVMYPNNHQRDNYLFRCSPLVYFTITEATFAQLLRPYIVPYEVMCSRGYPICSGYAVPAELHHETAVHRNDSGYNSESEPDLTPKKLIPSCEVMERTCVRCQRGFLTTKTKYLTRDICTYHWGKLYVTEGSEGLRQWTCCKGKSDAVGCTTHKLHVWNGITVGYNLFADYQLTMPRPCIPADGNFGVYAIDCEMCFTVAGLELTRVTVVAMDGRCVYEAFVKPLNEIVDFNNRFSNIRPEDLAGPHVKTLKQVQQDLTSFISAETILIGHGLENDLRALKLMHGNIVDTTYTFPHYLGFPFKRSLSSLVSSYLRRDIVAHDSYQDACACMKLMLHKVLKSRGQVGSWNFL